MYIYINIHIYTYTIFTSTCIHVYNFYKHSYILGTFRSYVTYIRIQSVVLCSLSHQNQHVYLVLIAVADWVTLRLFLCVQRVEKRANGFRRKLLRNVSIFSIIVATYKFPKNMTYHWNGCQSKIVNQRLIDNATNRR